MEETQYYKTVYSKYWIEQTDIEVVVVMDKVIPVDTTEIIIFYSYRKS